MEKKFTLPKEFAEKWVAALRSGDYTQGMGELTSARGDDTPGFNYCCLGVGCKVAGIEDKTMHPYSYLGKIPNEKIKIFTNAGIPIELVSTDLERKLIDLNDNCDYTFDMIADFIEESCTFVESK